MSIRQILEYPDPALSDPAQAVQQFDASLDVLIEDLIDTLRHHSGSIGLSAPQIGSASQVVVVADDSDTLVFINPTLTRTAVPCIVEERCLSLPGLKGHVLRSAEATVSYQQPDGSHAERSLSGMPAVCLQHEIDHLQGQLFLERLTRLRQWWYRRGLTRNGRSSATQPAAGTS